MEALIQMRRGTSAQWTSVNPVLSDGEPGVELDTGKGKFGHGGLHWNALPYSFAVNPQGPAGGALAGTFPNPTIANNSIGSAQIIDGSVQNADLANGSVTTAKIAAAPNGVGPNQLNDGAVVDAKLGTGSVTSRAIMDHTIQAVDLDANFLDGLKTDVLDEGTLAVQDISAVDFRGDGVTVAQGATGVATVTITGGSGGGGTTLPSATIIQFAGLVDTTHPPPTGWLLCDGSQQSRATFAGLYAALGGASSPYGQGNGTSTFNLPNLCGASAPSVSRVAVGVGPGRSLGASGGAEAVTLTTDMITPHTHGPGTLGTDNPGGHQHGFQRKRQAIGSTGSADDNNTVGADPNTGQVGNQQTLGAGGHTHGLTSGQTAQGPGSTTLPTPTMPPFLAVNFLIKT